MTGFHKAILRTLAYADVFNYPLTRDEVWKWLINVKCSALGGSNVETTTQNSKLIQGKDGFYFLKGRERVVELRKEREKWSKKKFRIAQRAAGWLKLIPAIKMVAVTGTLAMSNSDKDDDIDILIVSGKKRLWLTRFFSVLLVELLGQRRRPRETNFRDRICLNMFLDEEHMGVPRKEQDLFSAHEVLQMRKLWERDNTYSRFLWENQWVGKYLPNAADIKILRYYDIKSKKFPTYLITQLLNFFENLAYKIQLKHMKSRKTTEITEASRIRFHPQDARKWVLKEYSLRLKNLGLDK